MRNRYYRFAEVGGIWVRAQAENFSMTFPSFLFKQFVLKEMGNAVRNAGHILLARNDELIIDRAVVCCEGSEFLNNPLGITKVSARCWLIAVKGLACFFILDPVNSHQNISS